MSIVEKLVTVKYTNDQGKIVTRNVLPKRNWFGKTKTFPDKQWFQHVRDHETHALMDIPQQSIVAWKPYETAQPSSRVGHDLV